MIRLSAFFVVALVASASFPHAFAADVASVQCTIKSVDLTTRSVTVAYTVGTAEKLITLDVSRNAKITIKGQEVTLDALTAGDKATVEYNKELAIVTKIEAAGELLDGWTFIVLKDQAVYPTPDSAFIVSREGTLVCTAQSGWMLVTNRSYSEMVFSIEFQHPTNGKAPGGILMVGRANPVEGLSWSKDLGPRMTIEIKLWPQKCGEIFLPRPDFRAELPLGQIRDGRTVTRVRSKNAEQGQWNKMEVECDSHRNVTVKLNGELVNAIAKAENISGRIAIWPTSDCEIKFRNPTVTMGGKEEKLEFNVTGVIKPK
jgi:hypothetical protein